MADVEGETAGQKAARLRREKRNAKIQAEGNDRLARITQLSGRPAPAPEEPSMTPNKGEQSKPSSTMTPLPASIEDPDEVDISSSEHYWTPTPSDQTQLARLQQQQFQEQQQQQQQQQGGEDPMLKMLQQMMSGDPNAMGSMPDSAMDDLPPMLKAMMQGQRTSQSQASSAGPLTSSAYLWRIVHALFALCLGVYIAISGTFDGSKLSRASTFETGDFGPRLFYVFATAEVVLQSSRYFVEKGRLQGTGWLATIANSGLVPMPWAGYISMVGRYGVIWQTIVADAMVVVFVLGCLAWWNGMATA